MKYYVLLILTFSIITFTLINEISSHGHHHHHHHNKKKDKTDVISQARNHVHSNSTRDKNKEGFNSHNPDSNPDHSHSPGHAHSNVIELYFQQYIHSFSEFLQNQLNKYSKKEQAYIGAMLVSSASIPIFLIILIFKIRNIKLLDAMTSFASGALLADVLLHNLPEILKETDEENGEHSDSHSQSFFEKKEIYICIGVITLFAVEKIVGLLTIKNKSNDEKCEDTKNKNKKKKTKVISQENDENNRDEDDHHGHGHGHSHHNGEGNIQNIIISFLGDFVHNVTDGLAIGAAYGTNLKLGITLTISIFFHEIPHEVGDFCYLLKQKMNAMSAMTTQIFSATGAFIGVFISFSFGDKYSGYLLSFASGAFIYLSVNTILGDLKKPHSFLNIIIEMISFIFGVYFLSTVI